MSSTNVAVAVRCRPISAKETTIGSKNVVEIDSDAQSITITGTGDVRLSPARSSLNVYLGRPRLEHIYIRPRVPRRDKVRRSHSSIFTRKQIAVKSPYIKTLGRHSSPRYVTLGFTHMDKARRHWRVSMGRCSPTGRPALVKRSQQSCLRRIAT